MNQNSTNVANPDLTKIVKERKQIVRALNAAGYCARKFVDSETGILLNQSKIPFPFARLTYSFKDDSWQLICSGISDFINPMKIVSKIEQIIVSQDLSR